jgi:hypothetical protein
MQTRIDEARAQAEEARRSRDQASSDLEAAEYELRSSQQHLQQLQREQRTAENYTRIFGTREEMVAQGENYESPIGGMFSRAYDRFRAAEEARAEERTLREVLASEAAAGGEDEARFIAQLERRERDVWGVPSSTEPLNPPTLPVARRDVIRSTERDSESDTPPHLIATDDETMLQEYYAMIRLEDRRQHSATDDRHTPNDEPTSFDNTPFAELPGAGDDFPHNMLNAIRTARQRELADLDTTDPHENEPLSEGVINEAPVEEFSREQWWHEDANHIIRALTTNDELRSELGLMPQEASVLLSYFINDVVSEADRMTIDGLLRNPTAIWGGRLPAEWLQRRRAQVIEPSLVGQLLFSDVDPDSGTRDWNEHYNYYLTFEVLAQSFQMSAEVRRSAADITPPERLQMLYRLQAGQRAEGDIEVLNSIYRVPDSYLLAMSTYQRTLSQGNDANEHHSQLRTNMDATRRLMARDGNHSRSELEARRQETASAFALAAGRQAMQTGSENLIQQMTVRDGHEHYEGTRAAMRRLRTDSFRSRPARIYRQLTLSDYLNEGSSDSESESEATAEPQGLDATDSGRPEPKEDEDLKVQMECKVCYTQLAEVACLPCGHLVMCRWCSEQHSPCLQHDRTRPRRAAACPVCRKGIRQKVRVFRA